MKKEELIEKLKNHTIKTMEQLHDWCVYYTNSESGFSYSRQGVCVFGSRITLEDVKFISKKPEGFKTDTEANVKKMVGGKYYNACTNINAATGYIDLNDWREHADEAFRGNHYVGLTEIK